MIGGFWGKPTANMNWCEADYIYTIYLAELFNCLSSLCISLWGLYGIYKHNLFTEPRFFIAFFMFIIISFGSFLFHATLIREYQLADELPMLWANSVFIYICLSMHDKPGHNRFLSIMFLTIVTVTVTTLVLLRPENQDIFLISYATGILVLALFGIGLVNNSKVSHLFLAGMGTYGFGFVLWTIERLICPIVQPLQLHAFWHLCAGSGMYELNKQLSLSLSLSLLVLL